MASQPVSIDEESLELFKDHAKSEGLSFSCMVRTLFQEDIEHKIHCIENGNTIERLRLTEKRKDAAESKDKRRKKKGA